MILISATQEWRAAHPGAVIGLLELVDVENTDPSHKLDERKRKTEANLRERYQGFARHDLKSLPVMAAYDHYYKRFDKTYHVLLQVESIILKGKSLPNVSPLVDANFVAEVETWVLTAGHDAAKLHGPVSIDVSRDGDELTQMMGSSKTMQTGDIIMRDAKGICCSILYGQDNRSPISSETAHVLYVAYAPAGVSPEIVETQLRKIIENARLFSPEAIVVQQQLLFA